VTDLDSGVDMNRESRSLGPDGEAEILTNYSTIDHQLAKPALVIVVVFIYLLKNTSVNEKTSCSGSVNFYNFTLWEIYRGIVSVWLIWTVFVECNLLLAIHDDIIHRRHNWSLNWIGSSHKLINASLGEYNIRIHTPEPFFLSTLQEPSNEIITCQCNQWSCC
jgi:hypothetical protein